MSQYAVQLANSLWDTGLKRWWSERQGSQEKGGGGLHRLSGVKVHPQTTAHVGAGGGEIFTVGFRPRLPLDCCVVLAKTPFSGSSFPHLLSGANGHSSRVDSVKQCTKHTSQAPGTLHIRQTRAPSSSPVTFLHGGTKGHREWAGPRGNPHSLPPAPAGTAGSRLGAESLPPSVSAHRSHRGPGPRRCRWQHGGPIRAWARLQPQAQHPSPCLSGLPSNPC